MEPLNHPVALWMKSSGELVFDATFFAQGLPGGGGELGATVADNGGREAKN